MPPEAQPRSKAVAWWAFWVLTLTLVSQQPIRSLANWRPNRWTWLDDTQPLLVAMITVSLVRDKRDAVLAAARRAWPFIAMVALSFLSAIWSVNPQETFKASVRLAFATALGLVVGVTFTTARFTRLLAISLGVGLAVSLAAVRWAPELGREAGTGLWQGWYGHHNNLGTIIAIAIPATLLTCRRWSHLAVAVPIVAVYLVALDRSENKTTVFSLALVIVFAGIALVARVTRSWSPRARAGAWTTTLATLAVGFVTASSLVRGTRFDVIERNRSLTGRTEMWEALRPWIRHEWQGGFGYGAFFTDAGGYQSYLRHQLPPWSRDAFVHAHSGYVQLAVDLGLIGCVVGVLCVVWAVRRHVPAFITARDVDSVGPMLLIVAILAVNVTEPKLTWPPSLPWLILVALTCTASTADGARRSERHSSKSPSKNGLR